MDRFNHNAKRYITGIWKIFLTMQTVFLGAFLVSAVHAIMPDHWLPLVMVSRAEKWSQTETLLIIILVTAPHIISTITIGILVGLLGFQLSSTYESIMEIIAPSIFILIGFTYVYRDFQDDSHHHIEHDLSSIPKRSKKKIISFMATALFFSPCVPIGSYFFIIGVEGLSGLVIVSSIYVIVTLILLLIMVSIGRRGVEMIKWRFFEHHENLITGFILILIGVFTLIF